MLTKTIGQLDTETNPSTADYIPIEHSGVTEKISLAAAASGYSSATESVAGTSNSYLMTPLQVRNAFNATGSAPVYACRAWCNFNGATTSSSLTGTYTRVVGTTTTVCVATGHGYITGNYANVDFTSGGASDNTYLVTVTDADTFTVQTVSTSSVLTSAFTLRRCPVSGSGNVNSVSYVTTGSYIVNFGVAMPSAYYSFQAIAYGATYGIAIGDTASPGLATPTQYAAGITTINVAGATVSPVGLAFTAFA